MSRLVRLLLFAVVLVLLVEVVAGMVSSTTGALEKSVLLAAGVVLVLGATQVRRIGAPKTH